jgi:hypothetical protein
VFRYRLDSPDGDDLGEATYAQMIRIDEPAFYFAAGVTRFEDNPSTAAGQRFGSPFPEARLPTKYPAASHATQARSVLAVLKNVWSDADVETAAHSHGG